MTDKEIIKAFEQQVKLANKSNKMSILGKLILDDVLDLINRQKAEIERLKKENTILSKNADTAFQDGLNEAQDLYALQIKNDIKAMAIKEFAERLKGIVNFDIQRKRFDEEYMETEIDNLVKEMVGE